MEQMLSIVIPVLNEQDSLKILYEKIMEQVRDKYLYEILFIDDGSTDQSAQIVKDLREEDKNVHLIVFRKNFGKPWPFRPASAMPRETLLLPWMRISRMIPVRFPGLWRKSTRAMTWCPDGSRTAMTPLEKRLPSKLFNKVTEKLSGVHLHDFNCGFKAYRREVVENIDIYGELHRYIPVLANRQGFRITEIVVHHHKREYGKSKYGFERYLRGLFDSFTVAFLGRFYDRPMYFFGKIGLVLSMLGGIICLYMTYLWATKQPIGTRPLLQLGVLLLIVGVQMISIGFIGDMIVDATYHSRYNEGHIKEKM